MTVSAGSSLKKMSWSKGSQPSGWTAFDLKQKNKNNFESEVDKDPFPPIGSSGSMRHGDKFIKKKHVPSKPFSSVLLPNKIFPPLKEGGNGQKAVSSYDSDGKSFRTTVQEDANLATKKLKEQHPWAENSLIEDILAAVNNNVDKAVALLETMASAVNFDERKISSDRRATISENGESLTSEMVKDDILFHSNIVGHFQDNDKDLENRNASLGQKFSDVSNLKYKIDLLNSIPDEPEWEDDDIYISHRKDALKTMRSASRHSKAAANAFLKGEHFSAQQHSTRAREEWNNADKLNSEAATKILSIRNSDNDIWRLDLHGLHAAEAVQALQEHLHRIESQGFSKSSAPSNGAKKNGSVNFIDSENLDKQAPIRLRSLGLHVITGVGNHSRGQAALPTAVRSFLGENRYRFEETRPGVITVWPKFRQS
ncbi:hypothetical protein TSUD_180880 [Trifolium subterraneum]|uniref:Smr domain-containing protein n=1 Tax=Trifolium subterraneum TaxID=3900 RepID=A0A2Z6PBF4_TRISU|nr:hypothetical protein TSUD_180880 [Trifolium subterraneum]